MGQYAAAGRGVSRVHCYRHCLVRDTHVWLTYSCSRTLPLPVGMPSSHLVLMRWFRWIASAVFLPAWVAALLLALATACRAPTPVSDPKLGAGIREALVPNGEAAVMVALAVEPGVSGSRDAASVTAAIARAQDAVLSTLDSADFRLTQRYAAVPAFAGTLRSARGLDRLLAHPLVRRVDLDSGGTGSSSR